MDQKKRAVNTRPFGREAPIVARKSLIRKGFIKNLASGSHQLLCIRVCRLRQNLRNRARLHNLASFHDDHLMRHGPDHGNVMGDQQIAQATLASVA